MQTAAHDYCLFVFTTYDLERRFSTALLDRLPSLWSTCRGLGLLSVRGSDEREIRFFFFFADTAVAWLLPAERLLSRCLFGDIVSVQNAL